jgi:hypothetical protein
LHPAEAFTDLLEQLVADVMPERVVDLLEAVEVNEQKRHSPAAGERFVDRLVEPSPVGEPRKLVGVRLHARLCEHALFAAREA